jgi:hypothetical protein
LVFDCCGSRCSTWRGALAWTLQLVFLVLIVQGALTLIENTAFRYRSA